MTYLEDAAAELRKARAANDKLIARAAEIASMKMTTDDLDREIAARSLEIASGYAALAAIEAGLPPGCCHGTPAEGPEAP